MPNFSNRAPKDPRGYALPLVRCPTGKMLVAIITSDDLVGCATHYWGGRTMPCEAPECKPCAEGVPWRWHSWLGAWSCKTHKSFLFESTARVTEQFTAYRDKYGTLRGCKFRAQRRTSAANSRVYVEMAPANLEGVHLPKEPDLLKCLSIIWNIKFPELELDGIVRDVPRVVRNQEGNHKPLPGQRDLFPSTNENGRSPTTTARHSPHR